MAAAPFVILTLAFFIIAGSHGLIVLQPFKRLCRQFVSSQFSALACVDDRHDDVSQLMNVKVYDNTFHPRACEHIHQLAVDHNLRGNDGSSIFFRPPHNASALSPLENVIHGALTNLNDTCRTVEYWSREEYMNIDTHADIDEVALEDDRTLRCPEMAHVLYLCVKEGLNGPTCVFPKKRIGWGLEDNKEENDTVDLVTVPAVQGRILRFPGSAMHAVPRPAHRWLLAQEDEKAIRLDEQEDFGDLDWIEEDDDAGYVDDNSDCDELDEDVERSVLLFNTWPDDGAPPRGISRDYGTGALPDGIELDGDEEYLASEEAKHITEWEEDYGVDAERISCNAMSDWRVASVNSFSVDADGIKDVRVHLMGKQNRRVYPRKSATLRGPVDRLKRALEEKSSVSCFQLWEDESQTRS